MGFLLSSMSCSRPPHLALPEEKKAPFMKIVIPDDYQDMVHQLACYSLIGKHDVTRYRAPARDLDQLVERLRDADVVVAIRERVNFSRAPARGSASRHACR